MKKKQLKIGIGCLALVLCAGILLSLLQALLVPKYMTSSREGAMISEYYTDGGGHDVLFIGDCEVYESFTPPTLWEEYGITSYIRGSAQQLAWQSYYLLEDTLRYETPKAVVFNVYALKHGEPQSEAYNRMTLDGMKCSMTKWKAVLASMTDGESFLSYLFPLLRFHSRWKELTEEDLRYWFSRDTVTHNGYLMQTAVSPKLSEREGQPLSDYSLPETSMEYLEKMRVLCEENGIELILVKAPTNSWRYYWYEEWDEQICAYAEANALAYYNFIGMEEELSLDWSTDTYDGGAHLNVFGAEKLTSYFGALLQTVHGCEDHRSDPSVSAIWNAKLEVYQKEKENTKT